MNFRTITGSLGLTCAALLTAGCAAAFSGYGDEGVADGYLDGGAAFARMKRLAGSYDATSPDAPGTIKITYEVTSGGHALLEKLAPGGEEAMTSVYHLEGKELVMVHYCSIGNRPHLQLDRAHSTLDDLRFEWDSRATDIDPRKDAHIHGARIRFKDAHTVETEWDYWKDGKSGGVHTIVLALGPVAPIPPGPTAPASK